MTTHTHITDKASSSRVFELVREGGRSRPAVRCSSCGRVESQGSVPGCPAPTLANNFRRRGWKINKRHTKAVCPECQERTMQISAEATRALRKLFDLFDEHYIPDGKRYSDGWTNERIAKETGLSPASVEKHRLALFGPMVSAELLEAQRDLQRLKERLAELEGLVREEVKSLSEAIGKATAKVQGALG